MVDGLKIQLDASIITMADRRIQQLCQMPNKTTNSEAEDTEKVEMELVQIEQVQTWHL